MRIVVYPHSMEVGGSQLNAIDLAAAVRDRGHEVLVYSMPGRLTERVAELGLEHVPQRRSRTRPGLETALHLRGLVRARGIDVVHGWEWPPILEGYAATSPTTAAVTVGSIMSMAVAEFLPGGVHMSVGTERLLERERSRRGPLVALLEPPVDEVENRPGLHGGRFRAEHPAPAGTSQVVVVSRLARELKLEGIITAIEAVGRLAQHRPVRLVVVGDGPARDDVARSAARVNATAGREVVLMTGELKDPRGAYDAADVCLGMGGSALRAMAFAKPLVVQGEGGFFETLDTGSVDGFLHNGWYGTAGRSSGEAVEHLIGQLSPLLDDAARRHALGRLGRDLAVSRYGLRRAASRIEKLYDQALNARPNRSEWMRSGAAAMPRLASHKVVQHWDRVRGMRTTDDFNAVRRIRAT